jgi:hypothetical protein
MALEQPAGRRGEKIAQAVVPLAAPKLLPDLIEDDG